MPTPTTRRALVGDGVASSCGRARPTGARRASMPARSPAAGAPGIGEPTVGIGEPTMSRDGEALVPANGEKRGDTCHVDVIDRWGNMVAATPSGGWLQSSPAIPGLGFQLDTRAQMFWLVDGLPTSMAPGRGRARRCRRPCAQERRALHGVRHAGRRPAGPVVDLVLPAPRPTRHQPAGGDRLPGLPHRAHAELVLPARGASPARSSSRAACPATIAGAQRGAAMRFRSATTGRRAGSPPRRSSDARRHHPQGGGQSTRHAGLCRRPVGRCPTQLQNPLPRLRGRGRVGGSCDASISRHRIRGSRHPPPNLPRRRGRGKNEAQSFGGEELYTSDHADVHGRVGALELTISSACA